MDHEKWKHLITYHEKYPSKTLFKGLYAAKDTLFNTLTVKLYSLSKTLDPENHTPFSDTCIPHAYLDQIRERSSPALFK